MGKRSKKEFVQILNGNSPERDSEEWIIGGKNRYAGRETTGTC